MNRRPLVAIVCCWIIGVSILSLCQGMDTIIMLGALLLMLLGLGLSRLINPKLMLVCGLALLLASGERLWVEGHKVSELAEEAEGTNSVLTGHIASIVETDGDLAAFRLKATVVQLANSTSEEKMTDTVLIRIKLIKQSEQETASKWGRGDAVRVTGVLELPGDAGNFGAFDYRNFLKKQGIHWQLTAKGTDSVTVPKGEIPLIRKPLRVLDNLREAIGALMDRLYPHEDSGYMKGLVVGIRTDLNPEQFDNFARLGLTHVLAISGLHVGVVVFLLLQMGAWMRFTRERTLDMAIAMMPAYMLITGASPSAVRACLMAMIALWLARRHALKDGLHLLLAAALLMLIWNPSLVEDVSFQLSFIVTAGLILFGPAVTESLPIPWKWLKGPVAVTLTAQVVSFPLTAYYFHSFHLLSLPANFLLVPFISFVVMPLGMASIVLGAMWLPMGIIPAKLATIGNQLTFSIVEWLNGFLGLRTVWPQPSLLWVGTAYLLMGTGMILLKRRIAAKKNQEWWAEKENEEKSAISMGEMTGPLALMSTQSGYRKCKSIYYRIGMTVLVLAWFIWGYQPAWLDRGATISFINVGQGDSILIRTGKGKHILIDTGGTVSFRKPGEEWRARSDPYEVGRKLLVPLLLKRGIRELDALVLTHFDADHAGGAQAVIENIPVRALLFNGTVKQSKGINDMFQLALDQDVPFYSVHAPMEWNIDRSTKLTALFPLEEPPDQDDAIEVQDEQNERSIVLLVTVYGRSFLLPGDLEAKGEQAVVEALTNAGDNDDHSIDVLKAGHHGSKTSTTPIWLSYWQPQETVISAGRNNSYGHPHPTVLERLSASGSRILRTDRDGEIQYRILADGTMKRRTVHQGNSR